MAKTPANHLSFWVQKRWFSKGQMVLELLWLLLFVCGFLAVLCHLYEAGHREINHSQKGLSVELKTLPFNL